MSFELERLGSELLQGKERSNFKGGSHYWGKNWKPKHVAFHSLPVNVEVPAGGNVLYPNWAVPANETGNESRLIFKYEHTLRRNIHEIVGLRMNERREEWTVFPSFSSLHLGGAPISR